MKKQSVLSAGMTLLTAGLMLGVTSCSPSEPDVQPVIITNDTFWSDTDGNLICSQGGGIFRFTDPTDGQDKYFWYGAHYAEADSFAANPVRKYQHCSFQGVTLYTSVDLGHWQRRTDVLTPKAVGQHEWLGRLGVCPIKERGLYALLIQHDASLLIALAKSPLGPFEPYRHIDMTPIIGTPNTGDQTVFVDDDGTGYLVYSYGRGRNRIYLSQIGVEQKTDSIGLLDCTELFHGQSREGNCMFKYDGKYYISASNIYGWDSSHAFYLSSNNIRGPYTAPNGDMKIMRGCAQDYAHVSQTGFYLTVHGTEQDLVLYCGDRWTDFANNGLGYNQWVPIAFDQDNEPIFNSLSQWRLDAKRGRWGVGPENNYVLNGSFEADRRIIPLAVKPRQEVLTGWDTEVLSGNAVSLDNPSSPHLNRLNSSTDNRFVVGKMSLCISDSVAFERRVSQKVREKACIPLPDGNYKLSATVRLTGSLSEASMYAISGADTTEFSLLPNNSANEWHTVSLNVPVLQGKVIVGFHAKGEALAEMLVDDVVFVRIVEQE